MIYSKALKSYGEKNTLDFSLIRIFLRVPIFPLLSPNLGVLLALLIFDCEAVIGVIGISWSRRSSSSASSSSLFSSALIFVGNGVPLLFPIDRTVRGPGVAKFVSSVYEQHKLSFFWFNFHLPHNSQIHNE